ncbi:MAG: tryptophan--tRNA ligase [Chitinophagales bacterium]
MKREITVSGVRPTGKQHLGNYLGAVKSFVKMQDEYAGYFFIADYHSLTTHPKAADLQQNVKQTLIEYLACGLDPEKCVLFAQSDVPQVIELYLIFNMLAYVGELEKVPTFKEKVRSQPDNVNAGLLTYPVLMAADILIHHAAKVPIGKDQMQHLEMARNFGNRFNYLYGVNYFTEPHGFTYSENPVSVPSLNGQGKMSKSKGENSVIYLSDAPDVIRKKIMKLTTDSGPTQMNQEKPEAILNAFALLGLVSSAETVSFFEEQYNQCSIRYGDMKKQLAEDMVAYLKPISDRITEYTGNEVLLNRILAEGAEKARNSAIKTVSEVREIIGLKKFPAGT